MAWDEPRKLGEARRYKGAIDYLGGRYNNKRNGKTG